jgi:hypothetical protein
LRHCIEGLTAFSADLYQNDIILHFGEFQSNAEAMRQIASVERYESTLVASHAAVGARNEAAGPARHNKPTTINMTAI